MNVKNLFLAVAFGQTSSAKPVSFKSGDETISALLFEPQPSSSTGAAAKGQLSAIVVIHEWWGLNDWVKGQASKLAAEGYVALAVDLYRGKVAASPDEAHELMRGLPDDRSLRDMRAAVAYLKTLKHVDARRIGAIGWCMGGSRAGALAISEPTLRAVAINYGSVPSDKATLEKIHASVLGLYGAQDRGIPADSVRQFEKQMTALGKDVDIKIYDDAGHAFENPGNKDGYRPADAADAWKRITGFFSRTLKPAGSTPAKPPKSKKTS